MKQLTTLCLLLRDNAILLGYKKRGFGVGRWNGFGGKVRTNETIEAAMVREVAEESGINVSAYEKRGVITFHFDNDPGTIEMHVFSSTNFSGEPTESEEMRPQWFKTDVIPYKAMWADDEYWLPMVLDNKNFKAEFYFKNHDEMRLYHVVVE